MKYSYILKRAIKENIKMNDIFLYRNTLMFEQPMQTCIRPKYVLKDEGSINMDFSLDKLFMWLIIAN